MAKKKSLIQNETAHEDSHVLHKYIFSLCILVFVDVNFIVLLVFAANTNVEMQK